MFPFLIVSIPLEEKSFLEGLFGTVASTHSYKRIEIVNTCVYTVIICAHKTCHTQHCQHKSTRPKSILTNLDLCNNNFKFS